MRLTSTLERDRRHAASRGPCPAVCRCGYDEFVEGHAAYSSHEPLPFGRCRALTLIELLVVITIIALLIAMLLPSLTMMRQGATTTRCLVNTRQIATAMLAYEVDAGRLPRHAAEAGDSNLAHALTSPSFDARTQYEQYMNVDFFRCPHLPQWRPSEATALNVHCNYVLTPGYFSNRVGGEWDAGRWTRSDEVWCVEGVQVRVLAMDRMYRWHTPGMNIINHAVKSEGFEVMNVDNMINRGAACVKRDPADLRAGHDFNVALTDGSGRTYAGDDPALIRMPDRDAAKDGDYLMPCQ